MIRARFVSLALVFAACAPVAAQSHHEFDHEYSLIGEGSPWEGFLHVFAKVPTHQERGPRHQIGAILRLDGATYDGTLEGRGKKTSGTLAILTSEGTPPAKPGIAQRLEDPDAGGGELGGPAAAEEMVIEFETDRSGLAQGFLRVGEVKKPFIAQRSVLPIDGDAFHALLATQKQTLLWRAAVLHHYPWDRLPRLGSKEALNGNWSNNRRILANLRHLAKAFSSTEDVRPPRWKLRHPFGSTVKVVFEPAAGHSYTGLFRTGAVGLARLSLNVDSDTKHNPGIGLKLLVDGQGSRNLLASTFFDPQQLEGSGNYFAHTMVNENPQGRLPTDHVASVERDGSAVASPSSPRYVVFEPAITRSGSSLLDFRLQLTAVQPGTTIYRVKDGEGQLLGTVTTASTFYAADGQDRMLHFAHHNHPVRSAARMTMDRVLGE